MVSEQEIQVRDTVDHLFRRHAGQMVSVLARVFGFEHLELIEDAVQDALIAAMKKWPFRGIPENPRAWLIEVARNRVIDQLRRDSRFGTSHGEDADAAFDGCDKVALFGGEIPDDELRMIFACCHPTNSPDSQVALTLKIVSGFGVSEIARAFLAKEESIAKMLSRAKRRLQNSKVSLEIPSGKALADRSDAVLKILYLMFNEGYAASAGDELVRRDLCFEAIRLASILASHGVTGAPRVNALLALFHFQGSRLSARTGLHGELLLLADQDRSAWDQEMIAAGLRNFRLSASGAELTDYHLEAEIAAHYTLAAGYDSTDWRRILECYELLQKRRFSPIVELNRVIVLGEIHGADVACAHLEELSKDDDLVKYNLFHVTRAHFLEKIGAVTAALDSYQHALSLTRNESVRRFIKLNMLALKAPSEKATQKPTELGPVNCGSQKGNLRL